MLTEIHFTNLLLPLAGIMILMSLIIILMYQQFQKNIIQQQQKQQALINHQLYKNNAFRNDQHSSKPYQSTLLLMAILLLFCTHFASAQTWRNNSSVHENRRLTVNNEGVLRFDDNNKNLNKKQLKSTQKGGLGKGPNNMTKLYAKGQIRMQGDFKIKRNRVLKSQGILCIQADDDQTRDERIHFNTRNTTKMMTLQGKKASTVFSISNILTRSLEKIEMLYLNLIQPNKR